MGILQAVFSGLTQGLTEFLPIFGSGHLVIFQKLIGLEYPPIAFDILLHIGTFIAADSADPALYLKVSDFAIL